MSDSLKDRLSSHSNSFEGLLSLIPARYYYSDETNSQWKKHGSSLEEKKAEAAANRRQKFDPDVGSSALEETKRREQVAAERAPAERGSTIEPVPNGDSDEVDDSNVIIYDDHGNVISGEIEETVEQLLRAKAENPGQSTEPPARVVKEKAVPTDQKRAVPKPNALNDIDVSERAAKSAKKPKETSPDVDRSASNPSESSPRIPRNSLVEEVPVDNARHAKKSKEGIEELRAKLTARVNELKTKRRAPGSNASGAPRNREELLAARKLRLEQRKNLSAKRKAGLDEVEDNDEESVDEDDMADDETQVKKRTSSDANREADENSNVMFGQIEFGDGARLGKDVNSIEERRKLKKRNAVDQLKVLENRKQKMTKLDKEKQDAIADNAKWSRAILQSEGAKIRDDEKLLRKTIKQKQNRKKRAEKEWKTRIYNVKKGIAGREAKRHANISAHKEAKKLSLKGKKRRDHMKQAASNFKSS